MALSALQSGDLEAARYLVGQSYAFFPNGVAAQTEIVTGQDGRQVIVAYPFDAATGEPTTDRPMVITEEVLGNYIQHFSDEGAWNIWAATPAWLRMPMPTTETFAASSSVTSSAYS